MAERLAYSIKESADLLGVNYFSVYRLIQRGKLKACRALRGKLLVPPIGTAQVAEIGVTLTRDQSTYG